MTDKWSEDDSEKVSEILGKMLELEWGIWEDNNCCPICKSKDFVPASGNKKSDVLLVAEYPGEDEIKAGIPMVGPMSNILRTELGVLGVDFKSFRRMNVWFHPPNKNKECFEYGVQEVIKEAKDKRVILLMGDEVVKYFTGRQVTKVCGLQIKSDYLSCPHIFCCINPAQLFHRGHGVGELRLALHKFVEEVKNG